MKESERPWWDPPWWRYVIALLALALYVCADQL